MDSPFDYCIPKFQKYDISAEPLDLSEVHFRLSDTLEIVRIHPSQDQLRLHNFIELLRLAIPKIPSKINCEFILNMYEGVYEQKNQRFCFTSKPNSQQILIPDSHCFETARKVENLPDKPFQEKKKGAIFVGSDTGKRHSDGWTMRSLVSATYKNSSLVYSKLTYLDADTQKRLEGKVHIDEIYAPPMSLKEQLDYQIILNIDGNSTSWERLIWAMASNSLCVYVKPFDGENMISWYYPIIESLGLVPIIEHDKLENFLNINDFSNELWQSKNNAQKKLGQLLASINTQSSFLARVLEKYNEFYNS